MGNENKIFIKTTEKDGVLIDHYNDLYGLVSAWQNKKGEVNLNWCDMHFGRESKRMPVKIPLGDKEQAVTTLVEIVNAIERGDV